MLLVAVMLDLAGFCIFILGTWFGIDDYGIVDIIAGAIVGGWMLIRHSSLGVQQEENQEETPETPALQKPEKKTLDKTPSTPSSKPKATALTDPKSMVKNKAQEMAKRALKRFGLNFIIELIPFLGGLYPGWTILVYKELEN